MKRRLTTEQLMKKHGYIPGDPPKNLLDSAIPRAENETPGEQPLATIQKCLDVLYYMQRHDPEFGSNFLDGLRQMQKDMDHLISMASGDPPAATKKSSLLRQLAASTEFNGVSKQLIEKAEKLERQAEGLRYKFSKDRREKNQ